MASPGERRFRMIFHVYCKHFSGSKVQAGEESLLVSVAEERLIAEGKTV